MEDGTPLVLGESPDDALHLGARRRERRAPSHASVEVLSPRFSKGHAFNMSVSGVRVMLDREVLPGQHCTIRICSGSSFTKRARVVWTRPLPGGWIAGLEFVPRRT